MSGTVRRTLLATLTAALVVAVGCSKPPVKESDVVATWDDTSLTVAQFKDKMYVRYQNESGAMNRPLEDRFSILEEYIVRDCKLLEGYRLGFDKREDIQKSYKDAVERKSSDLLYDLMVRDRIVTPEMVQQFYDRDAVEVRARHILIAVDESVKGRDTLDYWNRINEVYQKAKAGEDFEKLVDKYSEDTSIDRSLHGDLGWFNWGKMVDQFEQAAWALKKPGDISPPVRTSYGYHIIQLIEKRSTGLQASTSHILVKCSRRASPAETTLAYEHAMEILKKARKSGADFAQLAKRYSEDRKTWNTGYVGFIPRGSMPKEYWETAFKLKKGEVGGPVRTYKGYHIIKVHEIRDERPPLTDPTMRDRIYSRLERVHREEINNLAKAFLDSIRSAFEMKYNQKVVNLLLKKLNDKNAPANMNRFSSLTADERGMKIVSDKLGGVKLEELVQLYSDHRFPPPENADFDYVKQLVEPIILPRYLGAVAHKVGVDTLPEVRKEGKRDLDNAMLPVVEREMVFNKAAPTEDEIKEGYDKNIKKYTQAATATVYEIMVDDKQLAGDLLGRIKKGEDISKLASRYSQRTKSKNKGGRLGPFSRDKYGAISRKAFELEPGDLAGPIEMGGKYSIIQLIEKTPERVKPLDEVRRQVEADVRFEKQKDMKTAWEEELKRSYKVTINRDLIKRVWPVVEPLSDEVVKERKGLSKQRREDAKLKERMSDERIQLKLKPGSTQEFTTKEGKKVQVKIGEPKYYDKEGNPVPPSKSNIKVTPKGRMVTKGEKSKGKPKIRITPKKMGDGK